MVYASEALGAPPVKAASLWTSSGFLSHHSPVLYERVLITMIETPLLLLGSKILGSHSVHKVLLETNEASAKGFCIFTKKKRKFFLGHWEGVWRTQSRIDNKGSIYSGSKPFAVSMPPQSAFLVLDCEAVCVSGSWLDGTLCDVFRSVCPWIS